MTPEFAVIATGGKQYLIKPEGLVKVEKIDGNVGDELKFEHVLLAGNGEDMILGQPFIQDAVVTGEIVKQGRAKKVTGVKFKAKKRVKVGFGHRQPFTEFKVKAISVK